MRTIIAGPRSTPAEERRSTVRCVICRRLAVYLAGALLALASLQTVAAQNPCANAAIRAPFSGETLGGNVEILGSARIDDFNFYKVEWAPADDPENWSAVSTTVQDPVLNGLLDLWNTETVRDGVYRLKLTVVDGAFQEVCRVLVTGLVVANETEPTATPTATEPVPATSAPSEAEPGSEPQEEPTPALEPIIPAGASSEPDDILDLSTWLDLLQLGTWVRAFLQGLVLGWVVAVLLLLARYLRRLR